MSSRTLLSNPTGWVELYLRKRKDKVYSYYRYCWSEGRRKVHHRHIAQSKLGIVEQAIQKRLSVADIVRLLK